MVKFDNIIDITKNSMQKKWEARISLSSEISTMTEILYFNSEPNNQQIEELAVQVVNRYNMVETNPRELKRSEMAETWRSLPQWVQEYYDSAFKTVSAHLDNGNDDLAYQIISIIHPPNDLEEDKKMVFYSIKENFLNHILQL